MYAYRVLFLFGRSIVGRYTYYTIVDFKIFLNQWYRDRSDEKKINE